MFMNETGNAVVVGAVVTYRAIGMAFTGTVLSVHKGKRHTILEVGTPGRKRGTAITTADIISIK